MTQYGYNPAGDLILLVDPRGNTNQWGYDQYGRLTNAVDATGASVIRYTYDADGLLVNRWTAAFGNTAYTYDQNGNMLTRTNSLGASGWWYDALNRVITMQDEYNRWTHFTYTSFGALASEDGWWDSDTVSYSYQTNHLRSAQSLAQPNAPAWVESYGYDAANRLQTISTPAGAYIYSGPNAGGSKVI